MKKVFLTFGDSSYEHSPKRIQQQAESMGCYDKLYITNESSLHENFRKQFSQKLNKTVKGFGYWCWKPQIILQALETLDWGDVLHYSDIGCHLNPAGKLRMSDYFMMASDSRFGILGFQNKFMGDLFFDNRFVIDIFPEFRWNKGDVLDHFNVRKNEGIINEPQIVATTMFIKKTPSTMALVAVWLRTIVNNFALVDDSPSVSPNLEGFVDHRHDQSIWSILTKLNNVDVVSFFETQYPLVLNPDIGIMRNDVELMKYYPILALRDKK